MEKKYYMIDGLSKFAVQETFEFGESSIGGSDSEVDMVFKNPTIEGVVTDVCAFLWTESADLQAGGVVSFDKLEDVYGLTASSQEIEEWKNGEKKLWSARYTGVIVEITEKSIE